MRTLSVIVAFGASIIAIVCCPSTVFAESFRIALDRGTAKSTTITFEARDDGSVSVSFPSTIKVKGIKAGAARFDVTQSASTTTYLVNAPTGQIYSGAWVEDGTVTIEYVTRDNRTATNEVPPVRPSEAKAVAAVSAGESGRIAAPAVAHATTTQPAGPGTPAAPAGQPAPAKDKNDQTLQDVLNNLANYTVDLSTPDTPALSVINGAPQTVLNPATPRQVGSSIISAINKSGSLGSGIGVDLAPFQLFPVEKPDPAAYRASLWQPILVNTQLSLAVIRKTGADQKLSSSGVGLVIPLYNGADPIFDETLQKCITGVFDKNFGPAANAANVFTPGGIKTLDTKNQSGYKGCYDDFKSSHWNASGWFIGGGKGDNRIDSNGAINSSKRDPSQFWSTGSLQLGSNLQALAHVRRNLHDLVDASNATSLQRNSTLVGAKLRWGSSTQWVSLEGASSRNQYSDGSRGTSTKYALGGEFKIQKDLWVVLSAGGEGGLKDGKTTPVMFGSLKYGFTSEKLDPPK
jgi:hypothetical protein